MCREGILHHDLLIVDRGLKATNGHIVIATIDGQFNIVS
jgi:SOS-response transcriptional repressor LexA